MFERRLYFHIDWALLAAILALCGIGVAMIYSSTGDPTRGNSSLYITQIYGIVLGLGAMGEQGFPLARRWLMWAAVSISTVVAERRWRGGPVAPWIPGWAAPAFRARLI